MHRTPAACGRCQAACLACPYPCLVPVVPATAVSHVESACPGQQGCQRRTGSGEELELSADLLLSASPCEAADDEAAAGLPADRGLSTRPEGLAGEAAAAGAAVDTTSSPAHGHLSAGCAQQRLAHQALGDGPVNS